MLRILSTLTLLFFVPQGKKLEANRVPLQINEFSTTNLTTNWDLQLIEHKNFHSKLSPKRDIVVAVIDTGIDPNHPDLKNHLWLNPGETGLDFTGRDKSQNGIDDDRNGYVDDVHGWNFVSNTPHVRDTHGHGSHVSGIITRLAPHVKIMALRYFDESSKGEDHIRNTIQAIHYARKNGAHIINYSAGGLSENPLEKIAIEQANRAQILFVAAAGNEGSNSEHLPYYPANYDIPNILSVTAVDKKKQVLPSSNYSSQLVDIAAPGDQIASTLPNRSYGMLTGTSQATAFVSGVAALAMSQNEKVLAPEAWIQHLVNSGTWSRSLKQKVRNSTHLNVHRALSMKSRSWPTNSPPKNLEPAQSISQWLPETAPTTVINRAPSGVR